MQIITLSASTPTAFFTRSFNSVAAFLVNVNAKILLGSTPSFSMYWIVATMVAVFSYVILVAFYPLVLTITRKLSVAFYHLIISTVQIVESLGKIISFHFLRVAPD